MQRVLESKGTLVLVSDDGCEETGCVSVVNLGPSHALVTGIKLTAKVSATNYRDEAARGSVPPPPSRLIEPGGRADFTIAKMVAALFQGEPFQFAPGEEVAVGAAGLVIDLLGGEGKATLRGEVGFRLDPANVVTVTETRRGTGVRAQRL